MGQVIHDITLMKIPVVVGIDRAGLVGGDGPTHQGLYDIAYLRVLPNIVFMAPKDENELRNMIYTAFQLDKPVFIRYPKEPGIGVSMDKEFKTVPPGKSEIVRQGKDGVILAVGTLVYRALDAAETLKANHNIDLTVVNIRYIKPMDRDSILDCIAKIESVPGNTKKIITIEDGVVTGGFGAQILELLIAENLSDYSFLNLGVSEEMIEVASREQLLARYNLNAPGIVSEIQKLFGIPREENK